MNLTEHFTTEELGIPESEQSSRDNATELCKTILEPIRLKWGPLFITSGERCAAHNHDVGGVPTSFHLYKGGHAAADFRPMAAAVTQVFTWICMESKLPFDQCILEYDGEIPSVIHVQVNCGNPPRRMGLVGMTHGNLHGRKYTAVEVK